MRTKWQAALLKRCHNPYHKQYHKQCYKQYRNPYCQAMLRTAPPACLALLIAGKLNCRVRPCHKAHYNAPYNLEMTSHMSGFSREQRTVAAIRG
ncbi:hypothetical protein [Undibacterium sp. TC9W]|uniref:hypothetical protein n=1 Tax=Undibacterium sp. TC9W TaxID=3413053 RepID=UPI003BF3A2BC